MANKRGRPPLETGTARDLVLRVRVSTKEMATVRNNAKRTGKILSDFIRRRILQPPPSPNRGLWDKEAL